MEVEMEVFTIEFQMSTWMLLLPMSESVNCKYDLIKVLTMRQFGMQRCDWFN